MLAPSRQTGSLNVLHFLFVFLLHHVVCLELQPSSPEVVLDPGSNFTVVCSGWSQVTWRSPEDSDNVEVEGQGSSSVLRLLNATWRNSGRYTCEEASAYQSREIDLFIPGRGPEEWFVPVSVSVVMQGAGLVATVPCVVSDPRLNVSLFERPGRTAVREVTFDPGRGFTGKLNDAAYVCVASGGGGAERESQVFYVFSVEVPEELQVELSVSSLVVRQGEVLTVNCTATDTGSVFFSWDFPRRQTFEPLTDFLPNQIRSFVNITAATVDDSGVYVCEVQETKPQQTKITKNITVTVLGRGYVYLSPGEGSVSVLVHQDVSLQVEVDAHPPPSTRWTRDNVSLDDTTTHLTGSRYVSRLLLTRVQVSQAGSYTVTVSNDDAVEEAVFTLEVKAPPRITSLVEVNRKSVMCVSDGAPPPAVTWYTCPTAQRCGNATDGWESQSAASEGVAALAENVTREERGVATVHSVLTLQSLAAVSAVRCEVQNSAGRRARELRVLNTSLLSQVAVLAAVLVLVVVAVIFLVILIILWRKTPGFRVRWRLLDSVSPDGLKSSYLDPDQLDYCSSWEVPRDHVVLGEVLGSGAFGRVVEATVSGLSHPQSTSRVAVKMVKPSRLSVQSLMSELKILIHVGRHVNLVNLLGACTRGGPVYLITEFCRHGDLVTFLHRHKHTFRDTHTTSDGDGGYMDMTSQEVQYVAMKELDADIQPDVYETPSSPSGFRLLSDSDVLDLHDLRAFCFQVANAMNFLSARQCVHRDVSARNVLVCEGKLLKICDFSLSRDLTRDQDYVARGHDFLPVRWMSPESLYKNVFTVQSDVWAFGVLLWEIFSLGETPYPDLSRVQDLYSALKSGYRMSRPDLAPLDMFELMTRCWGEEPQSRPSFSSLVVAVGNTLTDSYKKRYVQVSEDFLNRPGPPGSRSSPGPPGSRSSPGPAGSGSSPGPPGSSPGPPGSSSSPGPAGSRSSPGPPGSSPGPPGSSSSPGPPGSRSSPGPAGSGSSPGPAGSGSSPGPAGSGSSPGHQRDGHEDTDGSPAPQVTAHLLEAESEEAGPSHSSYIIPVSDSAAPDAGRPVDTPGGQEVTSSEEESCL